MLANLKITIGSVAIADPSGMLGVGGVVLLLIVILVLRKAPQFVI
jgi:hypothetical protein